MAAVARARAWLGDVFPRFWRFLVVGFGSTVLDVVLFNVFREVGHVPPLISKALSLTVAIIVTYGINRAWVFKDTAGKASGRQFMMFTVLAFLTLGVSEACLATTYYGMGLHSALETNISANVIGTGLGTVIRFFAYRRWVFVDTEPAVELALSTTG